MTEAQMQASDPSGSAWVAASAGTGKTKVLVDRVLRLLLDGVEPAKILCITFTNAAAAEMQHRIQKKLCEWAVMVDEKLAEALEKLTGSPPDAAQMDTARMLFVQLMEAPESVGIQTVHGFCGSVLRRFPVEAGIPPHSQVMDDRTRLEVLAEARMSLFNDADEGADGLGEALGRIAVSLHEMTFGRLINSVMAERLKWQPLLERDGVEGVCGRIAELCGVGEDVTEEALAEAFLEATDRDDHWLSKVVAAWELVPKFEQRGMMLSNYLRQDSASTLKVQEYTALFMNEKGEGGPSAATTLWPKKYFEHEPEQCWEAIEAEQRRILAFREQRNSVRIVRQSQALIRLADALNQRYEERKRRRGVLDHDDLIAHTLALFRSSGAAWVLFKLDEGLAHLLVDEAQDTSPAQWELVGTLAEEFYAGEGASEYSRTLFVVGDAKQSIYRFQGADPTGFTEQQARFAAQVQAAGQRFTHVALDRSFRTSAPVLAVVDAVFADEALRHAVGETEEVIHDVHRIDHAGHVELWPLMKAAKPEEADPAEPYCDYPEFQTGPAMMADYCAEIIAGWLADKRMLPAKDRPVRPDDIMILLRQRGQLAGALTRALKRHGVPVSGMDRLQLLDHMAVQDLVALGEWLLLPEDDLALAGVLKSPLYGISEEALCALAYAREEQTLWEALQGYADMQDVAARLKRWQERAAGSPAYDFYAYVLEDEGARTAFAQRLGDEVHDPLDEFIALTLRYEQLHTSGLQGFMCWLQAGANEVKRDMAQMQGVVRIMTIHGAKGLQAPVVMLPDMASMPDIKPQLLWASDKQQEPLMLWVPGSRHDNEATGRLREQYREAEMHEYARQLYVAMTRAEDELYMGGFLPHHLNVKEASAYALVEAALQGEAEECPVAHPHPAFIAGGKATAWVVHQAQQVAVETEEPAAVAEMPAPPEWLQKAAASEVPSLRAVSPSQLKADATTGVSRAVRGRDEALQRGVLIHQLLQYLPEVAHEKRNGAAMAFLQSRGVSGAAAAEMTAGVLALLDNPALASVFAAEAQAEVAVRGMVDGVLYHGQVDRLVVTEREVHVIDFKTNAQPPTHPGAIPEAYTRQMAAYVHLLQAVYPQKAVRASLLWTETGVLMPLEAAQMVGLQDIKRANTG